MSHGTIVSGSYGINPPFFAKKLKTLLFGQKIIAVSAEATKLSSGEGEWLDSLDFNTFKVSN